MQTAIKPDTVLKDYWKDNDRFADLFNQAFFHSDFIDPAKLTEQDSDDSSMYKYEKKIGTIDRRRDLIKQYKDGMDITLIGVENQDKVHYAMPIRAMLYDCLRYLGQCDDLISKHRGDRDLKPGAEFLSGLSKDDRIKPVITLVVYYGKEPWDGPFRLTDMMSMSPAVKDYVEDWDIHLLWVREASKFTFKNKDNQDLFKAIEEFYSKDGLDLEKLKQMYPNNDIYWQTMAAIGAATGSKELISYAYENEGRYLNMCTALENLKSESKAEGKVEGIQDMVSIMRELNIDDETIVGKIQAKFQCSREQAQELLA
jgi:hypothetical protein